MGSLYNRYSCISDFYIQFWFRTHPYISGRIVPHVNRIGDQFAGIQRSDIIECNVTNSCFAGCAHVNSFRCCCSGDCVRNSAEIDTSGSVPWIECQSMWDYPGMICFRFHKSIWFANYLPNFYSVFVFKWSHPIVFVFISDVQSSVVEFSNNSID